MLKSYFIRGLKPDLRHDVKLLRPSDVHKAIALAFQLDAKLADPKVQSFPRNSNSSTSIFTNPKSLLLLPGNSLSSNTNSRASTMRKISFEELQDRRKKGLCYSCPKNG